MMQNETPNRELKALMNLIDDPDEEVFTSVEGRLLTYGSDVIESLEDLWENTISTEVQDRIEMIIHRIHFRELKEEFLIWKNGETDLLHGALLVAKYQYPEIQSIQAIQEIERIRRNLWLEMNNFITPIEQIKIFDSILYNYYKMTGVEISYEKTDDFMLQKVLERKKGNALTNGILYVILCELLDIPVKMLNIPRQFVLGYFSHHSLFNQTYLDENSSAQIKFFIDPNSGVAFSHKDLNLYFERINVNQVNSYFKPMATVDIIMSLISELAKCYQKPNLLYKVDELNELLKMLEGKN